MSSIGIVSGNVSSTGSTAGSSNDDVISVLQ